MLGLGSHLFIKRSEGLKTRAPEILERAPPQCRSKTNLLAHWAAMLVWGCREAARAAVLPPYTRGAPPSPASRSRQLSLIRAAV